jgi:hypothetical protein
MRVWRRWARQKAISLDFLRLPQGPSKLALTWGLKIPLIRGDSLGLRSSAETGSRFEIPGCFSQASARISVSQAINLGSLLAQTGLSVGAAFLGI